MWLDIGMPIVVGDVLAPGVDRDEYPLSAGMVAKLLELPLKFSPRLNSRPALAHITHFKHPQNG